MYDDPIGYAFDGDIYCDTCLPTSAIVNEDATPITEDTETDSPIHCSSCGTFLGGNLLNCGALDLEKRMLNARISLDTAREYLARWSWSPWDVFETFYGGFDLLGNFHE